jgi:multicomponent Na+:H+ antiporter subunit G
MLPEVLAVAALAVGLLTMTVGLYGVLTHADVYGQLHAAGMVSGLGVTAILLASIATRDAATITHAALIVAFLLLTAPISSHAIAWAAYRRRADDAARAAAGEAPRPAATAFGSPPGSAPGRGAGRARSARRSE